MSGSGVLAVLTFARNRASGRRWLAFFVHSWAARAEWRLLSVETRSTEPRRGMMKGGPFVEFSHVMKLRACG